MKYLDQLLAGRTEAERRTLLIGAALAVPLFLWLLVWQPLLAGRASALDKVEQKEQAYQWMLSAAGQIKQLAPRGAAPRVDSPQQIITTASREQGIAINRIEPQSGGHFGLWIASADYTSSMRFIDTLNQRGLSVSNLTLTRLEVPGTVSLRLSLGGAE